MVSVTQSDFQSKDSPNEKYPDVYFIAYRNDEEIFKSEIFNDLHLLESTDFPAFGGFHCDLGTFLISEE